MKTHLLIVGILGSIGCVYANAQIQINQDIAGNIEAPLAPDFSGTYISGTPVESLTYTQPDTYPFTRQGARAHASFDPFVADPQQQDDCAGESVPSVIWGGNPMAITQENGLILMRFESGDTIRQIFLDGTIPALDQEHTITGFSIGHWEGNELRIETTHLQAGVLTSRGYPMSENVRLAERYWRDPLSNNLHMELVVEDPVNYTESVTLSREFIWSDEEQVQLWNCISLGPRFAEPDIDELVRMLEGL